MDPNDLRNIFRQFFGFQNNWGQRNDQFGFPSEDEKEEFVDEHSPDSFNNNNSRGFTVYSDPLEIHKYFDQQMDEMLKMFGHSFGFGGFSNGGAFGGFDRNDDRMIPFQPPPNREEGNVGGDVRDFMLKDEGQPKVDSEADWNQMDMTEIDKLMKNHNHSRREEDNSRLQPFMFQDEDNKFRQNRNPGSFYSFGSSMSEKSVRNSNGGVETTTTIRSVDTLLKYFHSISTSLGIVMGRRQSGSPNNLETKHIKQLRLKISKDL